MRPFALCFLSVLAATTAPAAAGAVAPQPVAQEPAPTPVPGTGTGSATQTPPATPTPTEPGASPTVAAPAAQDPPPDTAAPAPIDPPAQLAELERAGDRADPAALAQLASGEHATIAARAAFLLGQQKGRVALTRMQEVATGSAHADARAFAMQGVLRSGDVAATNCAIEALADTDRRVRTFAAMLLGKLRRPAAADPLLALIDETRVSCEPGPATDVQAALLAIADLGLAAQLLRVATAVHDSKAEGTGATLAWVCQTLAPKLPQAEQVTCLVALLGHREQLVRRYAIGRVAELGDPSTVKALEGRLGTEGNELRPLVEMALAQVRKDKLQPSGDELARATHNAQALLAAGTRFWNGLDTTGRVLVGASPLLLVGLLVLVLRRRRASATAAAAAAAVSLVQPSDEFVEQTAAEAERLAEEAEQLDGDAEQPTEEWQEEDAGAHR
jgi:HEAT repeat protein